MKNLIFSTALLVFLGLSPSAIAAGDAAAGKAKSAACAGCHGPDGNAANPAWPKLAGQHAAYLAKQLKDFKEGKTRKDPMMSGQVAGLSEQDMLDLAAFFASQTGTIGSADENLIQLGGNIYRGGNTTTKVAACMACHAPNGAGNPAAGFPRLAGQNAAYVAKALRDFRSGARSNDAGKMMRVIAGRMSDAEIDAVASYIQGLH